MKNPSAPAFASSRQRLARRIRQRKQPVQARAHGTVEALLEATLQVLRRDGYAGLTTTRVAERAGVSVGTLYQYFPDKRSLVTALKVHYFERIVGRVAEAGRASVGRPLEAAVAAMIEALLAAKRENLALVIALREPMAELGGDAFVREATAQLRQVTEDVLAAAAPELEHSERAAWLLLAALEGAVSFAVHEAPKLLESPEFARELVALAVGYLRQRAARA